jgi:hypothetical protein
MPPVPVDKLTDFVYKTLSTKETPVSGFGTGPADYVRIDFRYERDRRRTREAKRGKEREEQEREREREREKERTKEKKEKEFSLVFFSAQSEFSLSLFLLRYPKHATAVKQILESRPYFGVYLKVYYDVL